MAASVITSVKEYEPLDTTWISSVIVHLSLSDFDSSRNDSVLEIVPAFTYDLDENQTNRVNKYRVNPEIQVMRFISFPISHSST